MNIRSALLSALLFTAVSWAAGAEQIILFDFESGPVTDRMHARSVTPELIRSGKGHVLCISSRPTEDWPGITLKPAAGFWNISDFSAMKMDVENTGNNKVKVGLRADNPGSDGSRNCIQTVESFDPGEKRTVILQLSETPFILSKQTEIVGMRGKPGMPKIDTGNVVQLIIFVPKPTETHQFTIDNIRAENKVTRLNSDTFFPFIDEFGQFMHGDWPGKLHKETDFRVNRQKEQAELDSKPGPKEWNKYGGWKGGPRLKATGFFRVEKYRGKWWLVDPDGCLFWSHGPDCVNKWAATGVQGREHYFKVLPGKNSPYDAFYGKGWWAPHGFYKDKVPFRTFNFFQANLKRKYGENAEQAFTDITHRRLRSWGMNTVANWSSRRIYIKRKTPYTATVNIGAPPIEGSQGYWGKFPDVFDPGFKKKLSQALDKKKEETGDPWCIGFFVDNELSWGDETSLALAALSSPGTQKAKVEFINDLKKKYGDIRNLNKTWGTAHASWNALLACAEPPDQGRAYNDLAAFYTKTAETYFRTIHDELEKQGPNLYLGCRFAWVNDRAVRASIKYCDVVSFNKYTTSVEHLKLPDNTDLPVIIGEFHFGALDRGMFHTGLVKAENQKQRAEMYTSYLRGALRNPLIIGAHWFQYKDEPTAGRGDGENYQIGLINVCDTPYPETIEAVRDIGYQMYTYRLQPD